MDNVSCEKCQYFKTEKYSISFMVNVNVYNCVHQKNINENNKFIQSPKEININNNCDLYKERDEE